jgi:hypothetical protein
MINVNATNQNGCVWIGSMGLVLLLFCSCTTISEYKKMEDLDNTLKAYSLYIKWSEFESASLLRTPGQAPSQYVDIKTLKDFKVTSYDVTKQFMPEKAKRMERVVEIGYYKKNQMNVKMITVQETWEYDPSSKKWLLKTPLPSFQ